MKFFKNLFRPVEKKAPGLDLVQVNSLADFERHYANNLAARERRAQYLEALLPDEQQEFDVAGFCFVCRRQSAFLVDYQYCVEVDGRIKPNWRERLVCNSCQLNARTRATIQVFEEQFDTAADADIYMTEQTTPQYAWFQKNYPGVIGSEFLGENFAPGEVDRRGLRHEDLTCLSLQHNSLDYILSFDVFEHIPDHLAALKNCYDCLRHGGQLYFSVPFIKNSPTNVLRARFDEHGRLEHLLPPQYHGDPVSAGEGCLCFHEFGWELLDQLREIGFEEATGLLYWSKELAYLGDEQILFKTAKPA
jgi:SAM-dependent methyltransferase